ncbi:MAG: Gfo/Idh/MocA family oxidoreductase [Lachnospiraceae bacterium]|nr:Gfo/Idh/MocA family oxidoreductase [Lachnospiraceae bacterium]
MKIALIGFGYWGPNLARNIRSIGDDTLYGISEMNVNRLDTARSIYGDAIKYTTNYMDFLIEKEVDAVAIATQTAYSFQIAIDALEHGKHIFIEKPIASTVERAKIIQEEAMKRNLVVHCDHIMLYHPVIRFIKGMLDCGELGDLMYIDISRINLGPIRQDVNALLDLAVHDIAVIDYLSGGQVANKVSAIGQACFGQQETLTYLTIKYPTFMAHIKSSWVSPIKERRSVFAGTKKMVVFDDVAADKLIIYDHGFEVKRSSQYGDYEYKTRLGDIYLPHIPQEDALRNSIEHFIGCVIKGEESLSGTEHSIKVMKILEEALNQIKEQS